MVVCKIGGPAYRIGVGGGAASSRVQGDTVSYLMFLSRPYLGPYLCPYLTAASSRVQGDTDALSNPLSKPLSRPYLCPYLCLYLTAASSRVQGVD